MIKSLNESDKKMKNKGSKIGKIILSTFIIIIILIIGGLLYLKNYYDTQMLPVAKSNIEEISVEIPQGSSTVKIAQILYEKGLIRDEFVFRINAKLLGMDGSLKAGKYKLTNGMSQDEILNALKDGGISKETRKFTIPEGYELKEIVEKLSSEEVIDKDKFMELASNPSHFVDEFSFLQQIPENLGLEGYLYPDTYEIFIDADEEEIIKKMLSRFEQLYTDEIRDKAKELNMSLNEVITLASIIEREAMLDEERNLVSAVFHNRLEIGQPLQSCATVQFVLQERKPNLLVEDTQIKSEYNTYINPGLPPGPIASPGITSIEAAVNPADVDYRYFVSNGDGTGSHTFSKTYREHLNAKNRINNK